jgi:hypothetical protein
MIVVGRMNGEFRPELSEVVGSLKFNPQRVVEFARCVNINRVLAN